MQSKKTTGGKKEIMEVSDMQWSQSLPQPVKKLAEKAAQEGMTQTRSGAGGEGEDEKFRITLELRHCLLKFFEGPQVTPEYKELPPILVVHGKHCRLSNIYFIDSFAFASSSFRRALSP